MLKQSSPATKWMWNIVPLIGATQIIQYFEQSAMTYCIYIRKNPYKIWCVISKTTISASNCWTCLSPTSNKLGRGEGVNLFLNMVPLGCIGIVLMGMAHRTILWSMSKKLWWKSSMFLSVKISFVCEVLCLSDFSHLQWKLTLPLATNLDGSYPWNRGPLLAILNPLWYKSFMSMNQSEGG